MSEVNPLETLAQLLLREKQAAFGRGWRDALAAVQQAAEETYRQSSDARARDDGGLVAGILGNAADPQGLAHSTTKTRRRADADKRGPNQQAIGAGTAA